MARIRKSAVCLRRIKVSVREIANASLAAANFSQHFYLRAAREKEAATIFV